MSKSRVTALVVSISALALLVSGVVTAGPAEAKRITNAQPGSASWWSFMLNGGTPAAPGPFLPMPTDWPVPTGWGLINGHLLSPKSPFLYGVKITNAKALGASLIGADLSGANLRYAGLETGPTRSAAGGKTLPVTGMDLSRANLSGAWFIDSRLEGKRLTNVNLSGANLSGAELYGARLSNVNLSGADLRGANLNQVYLSQVSLNGANLSGVNLRGTDLAWNVNLSGANLSGANLSGRSLGYTVNLTGANLRGANLRGANLSGVNLTGVTSGGIVGTPASLPTGWKLVNGYLVRG